MTSTSENLASTAVTESSTATERYFAGLQAGEASQDKIISLTLSLAFLPLARPISDAKVLTGRQKPMTEIAFLFAEITTSRGTPRCRLQLLQACRRPWPVRPRQGDCRRRDR